MKKDYINYPSNSFIRFIKGLRHKKNRLLHKCFIIEGEKSILDTFRSECVSHIDHCILNYDFYNKYSGLTKKCKNIYILRQEEINAISILKTNNTGILVCSLKNILPKRVEAGKYIALDSISDPGNFGSVMRIADWYGIGNIICEENTVECYSPKVIQASMGSFLNVQVTYTNLELFLKNSSLPTIGTFLHGISAHKFNFPQKGILVFGNESQGINAKLRPYIDYYVTIPKFGNAESLNVAIACGVLCDRWLNVSTT